MTELSLNRPAQAASGDCWPGTGRGSPQTLGPPAPRAGWISILLLERLRDAVQPPGSRNRLKVVVDLRAGLVDLPPSRVDQHAAIGMAAERRATTRLSGRTIAESAPSDARWTRLLVSCWHTCTAAAGTDRNYRFCKHEHDPSRFTLCCERTSTH